MTATPVVNRLRAITVRQPWARCIAIGRKTVENRTRPTSYRGPVAIHAAVAHSVDGLTDRRVTSLFGADPTLGQPRGAVIAVAELVDCHPADGCCLPWGDPTGHHLVLDAAVLLADPVPARGALGLPWRLDEATTLAVLGQVKG